MSLPPGLLSFSTVSLPASSHNLLFSASLPISARHDLKHLQDWRLPWGGVRNVGRQKQNLLVCWRPGEVHAESERGDRIGSLQGLRRQRAGWDQHLLSWSDCLKALISVPLSVSNLCKRGHACSVRRTYHIEMSVPATVLMQLQRVWLQGRTCWVLAWRT